MKHRTFRQPANNDAIKRLKDSDESELKRDAHKRNGSVILDVRPVYTIAIQDLLYDRTYTGWVLSDNGVRRILRRTLGKKKARALCRAAMRGAK